MFWHYTSEKCNNDISCILYALKCPSIAITVHEVLGLKGSKFQSLYHFTVGGPVLDKRIMSLPAYPGPSIDA